MATQRYRIGEDYVLGDLSCEVAPPKIDDGEPACLPACLPALIPAEAHSLGSCSCGGEQASTDRREQVDSHRVPIARFVLPKGPSANTRNQPLDLVSSP